MKPLPLVLVAAFAAPGCYPVRNPAPAGPAADTALSERIVAPARDPADDPDTVSPVEPQDAPGDAGTLSPGLRGAASPRRPEAEPVRLGAAPEEAGRHRAAGDGRFGDDDLARRQRVQRLELETRKAFQESGRVAPGRTVPGVGSSFPAR